MYDTFPTRILRILAVSALAVGLILPGTTGCKKKEVTEQAPAPTPVPPPPSGIVVYTVGGHLTRLDLQAGTLLPITTGRSTEWFPACSPNGTEVAFWSNAGTNVYNLWKVDVNGAKRIRLTEDPEDLLPPSAQNLYLNNAPAWSPDGKKICYSLSGDLWETDGEGYNPRTLLSGKEAFSPAYSPKDASLVFVSAGDGPVNNLYRLNLNDYSVTKVTNYTDWNVGSPSFSSDGSKLLFVLYRENVSQIYVMNADGTNSSNLTTDNVSLCPRFAQNDTKVVFCSPNDQNILNVCMMTAAGTDRKVLTTLGGSSPTWAAYLPVAPVPTPVNP